MHICQIMLVDAETSKEAFATVKEKLDDYGSAWWDWNEAEYDSTSFAGRWSGEVFSVNNSGVKDDFLCYANDPALADQVIQSFLEARTESIVENYQALLRVVGGAAIEYSPYTRLPVNAGMDVWQAKKYLDLLDHNWNYESGIYDLANWTASLEYMVEMIKTRPNNLWLIPVDFHF